MAGMSAATLRLLADKGLSMSDIIEVAESMEKKADRTNAERQARYRTRRKRNAVTVTDFPPIDNIIPPVSSDEETTPVPKIKRKAAVVLAAKPAEVNDKVWRDFIGQRKTPFTETALDRVCAEAAKAGWTVNAALAEAAARGWQSFTADWVESKSTGPPSGDFLSHIIEKNRRQTEPAHET